MEKKFTLRRLDWTDLINGIGTSLKSLDTLNTY